MPSIKTEEVLSLRKVVGNYVPGSPPQCEAMLHMPYIMTVSLLVWSSSKYIPF